ncbi:MAG: SpoIIE family protein phosphatase [Chloroflexota bacterium]
MKTKPLILIVDDEPYNIDYLEQELDDLGYETVSAANGKLALALVAETKPDMILLDIMMPIMDGFEVLEKLNQVSAHRDIPVVVISAVTDMESIVKGIELGADDYLPKPFDPVLLQARLRAGLEKKRLRDIEKDYLRVLEREFEIGQEMQAGFLPQQLPVIDGWEIASFFQPARNVAGDFYDVFKLPEAGKIGLIVGDVCDKGVGAALYMTLFRSLLRALFWAAGRLEDVDYAQKLVDVIAFTNTYICQIHNSASFATVFFGILDVDNGQLVYVSAGHDPPLLIKKGQIAARIMPTGPAVGMFDEAEYQTAQLTLGGEEALFLFTDGMLDSLNPDDLPFGQDRFEDLIKEPSNNLGEKVAVIADQLSAFIGDANQFDDLTLVAVGKRP